MTTTEVESWTPDYSPWRHGGWYVGNTHYPSGGCGCVSNNYEDKKWRVACGPYHHITFPSRDAAARGEHLATEMVKEKATPLIAALYYLGGGGLFIEDYGRLCFCPVHQVADLTKKKMLSQKHATTCDDAWKAFVDAVGEEWRDS